MKTTSSPASDLADNLDGFPDSADLNQHIARLLAQFPADPQTYHSEIPQAYLNYARVKARAMDCRASGLIEEALTNERACELFYRQIPMAWRW